MPVRKFDFHRNSPIITAMGIEILSNNSEDSGRKKVPGSNGQSEFGDLIVRAAASGVSGSTLKEVAEAVGGDLEWRAEDSPAVMKGTIFLDAAERVRHGYTARELAESYNEMFGIPVQEALKRIKMAGERT